VTTPIETPDIDALTPAVDADSTRDPVHRAYRPRSTNARDIAQEYIDSGFSPIPVRRGTKIPRDADFLTRTYAAADFAPDDNIGLKTINGLVSVDIDCREALACADSILPETGFMFGRASKPAAKRCYLADVERLLQYKDLVTGEMLVELRVGHHDVAPPSLHDSGELVDFYTKTLSPAAVQADMLRHKVALVATTAELSRYYPQPHARHDWGLAVSGLLRDRGLPKSDVILVITAAAKWARDDKVSDRLSEVRTTFARGDKPTTGASKLVELMGDTGRAFVRSIHKFWSSGLILDPKDAKRSAEYFVERRYTYHGIRALQHQGGVFYAYDPATSAYYELDRGTIRSEMWKFLATARIVKKGKDDADEESFKPDKTKVANVLEALEAICNVPARDAVPRWLVEQSHGLPAGDFLPCKNGLLHVPTRTLYPPTPALFAVNGIDVAYDANAPVPTLLLTFLAAQWADDPESIAALQEFVGYLLLPDTRFQKMLLLHGPKRSGKGVIGRLLQRLVGDHNSCNPTLAAFARGFGRHVLIDKTLAVISDARIGGRVDTAPIAEILLSISGEDRQTIERKFLPDWDGKLSTRIVILTNLLPKVDDAAGALASRFVLLRQTQSFFGREDLGLFDRLIQELPGILNWALDGRARLYARGHFVQPASGADLLADLGELGSPEANFLRECVEFVPNAEVPKAELFAAWTAWCAANGHEQPGTTQSFGRNLRAALPPHVTPHRRTEGDKGQVQVWRGMQLLPPESDGTGAADAPRDGDLPLGETRWNGEM
jgi:putative DNA primase/helicase